jgi:hypothetical protein
VCVGLVWGCAFFPFRAAHADAATPTAPNAQAVIRDLIWAWGNPEMAEPGEHTAASFAQASPFQRARLLGAPNIMMGGHGLPDDDEEADRLTREVQGLDRILWEIGPDAPPGPPFVYTKRLEQVRKLADKYPKIEGVVLDDMSTSGIDNGFKPEHIREIRALLPGERSRVKIWGVVYTMNLDREGINEYIEELDVILLAEWHADNVVNLEENVTHCERLFPDKPIVLALYLYDYGANIQIRRELLEEQCKTALSLAHAGRIEGIEFTTIDNDEEAVRWTADWIERVGNQELEYLAGIRPVAINKFYFLFHPVCWGMGMRGEDPPPLPEGVKREDYLACYEWEKEVNQRQKDFISEMKPNEALLVFPIGAGESMLDLERHAQDELGRRCVFVREVHPDPPEAWGDIEEPIRQFLDNEDLDGKKAYLEKVPPPIREELESEIREACRAVGYNWSVSGLEVLYTSRMFALDIQNQLAAQGLTYDPATVRSEAFGEGFEQCAMTWKAMVVPYLGIASPADNIFNLSVSPARFLVKAKFKERIELANDVRLYLWEGQDGRPIGFYARAWCRLRDPQVYAHLPLENLSCEVWTESSYGTKVWPGRDFPVAVENDNLKVPILNGIRRDSSDGAFYIIGNDMAFDEFRECMVGAAVSHE